MHYGFLSKIFLTGIKDDDQKKDIEKVKSPIFIWIKKFNGTFVYILPIITSVAKLLYDLTDMGKIFYLCG